MGFIAAARRAGYNPNSNPTISEMPTERMTDQRAILGSSVRIVGGSSSGASSLRNGRKHDIYDADPAD